METKEMQKRKVFHSFIIYFLLHIFSLEITFLGIINSCHFKRTVFNVLFSFIIKFEDEKEKKVNALRKVYDLDKK